MIDLAQWRTAHFWLALAGTANAAALTVLLFTHSPHLLVMGVMALVLVFLHPAAVVRAAAWLPARVRGQLDTADVKNMIAAGIGALLERAGLKIDSLSSILAAEAQASLTAAVGMPPATAPTTVAVSETVAVTK